MHKNTRINRSYGGALAETIRPYGEKKLKTPHPRHNNNNNYIKPMKLQIEQGGINEQGWKKYLDS